MAQNNNTITGEAQECDDWIEIHNNGASSINLAGKYLADEKVLLEN